MVYNSQLVVVVKVNGKIMREMKDVVKLPFGTEYSILLKNLNTKRAVVRVDIDNTDALDGEELVIDANSEMELKRFIVDGNMNTGPRFKFIEKTEKISDHRGDKIDDGIIRIEWQYEKPTCYSIFSSGGGIREVHHHHNWPNSWATWGNNSGIVGNSGIQNQVYMSNTIGTSVSNDSSDPSFTSSVRANCCLDSMNVSHTDMSNQKSATRSVEANEEGITVKGSDCDQQFHNTTVGLLEAQKHSLCLKLVGTNESGKIVKQAVTVTRKKKCDTCGRSNSSRNKFCSECGTNLNW